MNAASKPTVRISSKVCWKSSSDSLWKPVNMSVVMVHSGITRRMAATRSRYHSRVYLRFMALSTELLPDCTGRWMCLQMLGRDAMALITSSLRSLGCEVVKRTRMSGAASATAVSRAAKSVTVPSSASKR